LVEQSFRDFADGNNCRGRKRFNELLQGRFAKLDNFIRNWPSIFLFISLFMRMHRKCVPKNRVLLNAQLTQNLPYCRSRTFLIRAFLDGKSVTYSSYARNPLPQEIFACKRDPAVSTTAMTRRFSAKNKSRLAVEMSCQPGQLCIWIIAGLAVGAMVAPWV